MGALWGWCCQGSAQGQCGRGCPRPWQGQTPPPPKAHHPEAAAAAAAAATGSVARGPARPWLGGRPDRRTEAPGSPRSQPQPRGPARPPAPSPRPGGFREPRPGEGGERGAGGAASGAWARALAPPRSPSAPRDSPARSRNGVSAGRGPNTRAPVRREADTAAHRASGSPGARRIPTLLSESHLTEVARRQCPVQISAHCQRPTDVGTHLEV